MHAVEHREAVALRDAVHGLEQRIEAARVVDVLLAVGRQQHVAPVLQTEPAEDVGRLDAIPVGGEHLGHGGPGDERPLLGRSLGVEVAPGVLGVAHVHVGDVVDDAAVRLLGKALVEAAVAGLHVEDGDVQALRRDGGEAAVRVAQDQERVGPHAGEAFVGARDHVADGLAEAAADDVEVFVGLAQPQVLEEYLVELVVVVLARVHERLLEVAVALLYRLGQADDLGAGAHDGHELELAHGYTSS